MVYNRCVQHIIVSITLRVLAGMCHGPTVSPRLPLLRPPLAHSSGRMRAKLVHLIVVELQNPSSGHSPQELPVRQAHVMALKEKLHGHMHTSSVVNIYNYAVHCLYTPAC